MIVYFKNIFISNEYIINALIKSPFNYEELEVFTALQSRNEQNPDCEEVVRKLPTNTTLRSDRMLGLYFSGYQRAVHLLPKIKTPYSHRH